MTAKVRFLPSDKEVRAIPEETILEAALRAGLPAKYNCNNGSCGECRARLVSGELGLLQHHDYPLSESDKTNQYFLMCSNHAKNDLVIEADLISAPSELPEQTITTKVYKVHAPRDDIRVIELRTPRSNTLRFLAGQHVRLQIGDLTLRDKSIASCPCNGRFLQFHFYDSGDDISDYVFRHLTSRDEVQVKGPYGDFVFDDNAKRPVVFIAHGIGFSPIKSLIEHVMALEIGQPLHLYWLLDKPDDAYMLNYCHAWVDECDHFDFDIVSPESLAMDVEITSAEAQRKLADLITAKQSSLSAIDLYLSGPRSRYQPLLDILLSQGLKAERLYIDELKYY